MFIQQNLMFCGIVPFPINCGQDAVCSTGYSEARLPPSSALALPGPLHRPTAQSQASSWKIKEPGSLDNLQPLKPSGFRPRSEEVSQSLSKLARSPSQSKDLENLKSPRGFCTSGIAQFRRAWVRRLGREDCPGFVPGSCDVGRCRDSGCAARSWSTSSTK